MTFRMMNDTEKTLFALLRAGLHTDGGSGWPDKKLAPPDWETVFTLACRQGVAAVAWDGLQRLSEGGEAAAPPVETLPRGLKLRWFGHTVQVERTFRSQERIAVSLAEAFGREGISTVVLKGLAAARRYPVPAHRPCGDLDCFLMGDYERGNVVAERLGATVRRDYYKNSHILYKGLMVENHRFCTAIRGSSRAKRLERRLQGILTKGPCLPIGNTPLLAPPPMFDALFLSVHAWTHLLMSGGIALRHLCDWAMWLHRHGDSADWERLLDILAERDRGLRAFAGSMTRLACALLGVKGVGQKELKREDRLLWRSMLYEYAAPEAGRTFLGHRLWLVDQYLRGAWKYRCYSERSLPVFLLRMVGAYLVERTPRL